MGRRLAADITIVLVTTLAFLNALPNTFHLDDWYRVVDNPGIETVLPLGRHFTDPGTSTTLPRLQQYRPLLPLTLSINYAIAGDSVVGYHVGNLLIHVVGALVLLRLLRRLMRSTALETPVRRDLALAATLLYAVHPVAGVPVNYICARDLLLMQMFLVTSLWAYVRLRQDGGGLVFWPLAIGAMALSILSKTNAVALPLVILAYELCFGEDGLLGWRTWARVLPFASVAAAFFVVTTKVLEFSDVDSLALAQEGISPYVQAGMTQAQQHLTHYLRNVVWPFRMRALPMVEPARVTDVGMWAGLVVIVGTVVWAWRKRRALPVAAFAVFAYWLFFAPTSSVLPFRYAATDYRAYPSLAWVLLAAVLLGHHLLSRRGRRVAFAVAFLYAAGATVWHNTLFRTEESFWEQSVRYGARPMAHVNYAQQVKERDPALARHHFGEALRVEPGNVIGLINLGLLDIREGLAEEGVARVRRAADSVPGWADARHWLAIALASTGAWDEAADASVAAARLDPNRPLYREHAVETLYRAAELAEQRQDYATCHRHLTALHELAPRHRNSHFLAGWAAQRLGRDAEAIDAYRRQIEVAPGHAQTRFNLAYALMKTGRPEEALEEFRRTLELRPDYHEVHLHIASCLSALGDESGAEHHRQLFHARG